MQHSRKQALHFILIDDDPLFAKILMNVAYQEGIYLDCIADVGGLEALPENQTYDGAIIDFHLGSTNGLEAALQLKTKLGLIPMMLVSNSSRHDVSEGSLPAVVKRFQSKSKGYHAILCAAKDMGSVAS